MPPLKISETEIRWDRIVRKVGEEFNRLAVVDRDWLSERLARIAGLKRRMHLMFISAGGAGHCAACLGACCGSGRNHVTLVELLAFLIEDEAVPPVDFEKSCPFLGPAGCVFISERRPFNCITFLCETVESNLSPTERREFSELEKDLRSCYAEFENRFPGASLRGLLIRSATLNGQPFLGGSGYRGSSPPDVDTCQTNIRSRHS